MLDLSKINLEELLAMRDEIRIKHPHVENLGYRGSGWQRYHVIQQEIDRRSAAIREAAGVPPYKAQPTVIDRIVKQVKKQGLHSHKYVQSIIDETESCEGLRR
ncbi:MAG: hypothetical protein V1839_00250 [archaeon]